MAKIQTDKFFVDTVYMKLNCSTSLTISRVFKLQLLFQYKFKLRFQGVHWKADFMLMSKMTLNIKFDHNLRKI